MGIYSSNMNSMVGYIAPISEQFEFGNDELSMYNIHKSLKEASKEYDNFMEELYFHEFQFFAECGIEKVYTEGAIGDIFKKIIEAVKSFFSKIWDFITGLFTKSKSSGSSTEQKDAIEKAEKSKKNIVKLQKKNFKENSSSAEKAKEAIEKDPMFEVSVIDFTKINNGLNSSDKDIQNSKAKPDTVYIELYRMSNLLNPLHVWDFKTMNRVLQDAIDKAADSNLYRELLEHYSSDNLKSLVRHHFMGSKSNDEYTHEEVMKAIHTWYNKGKQKVPLNKYRLEDYTNFLKNYNKYIQDAEKDFKKDFMEFKNKTLKSLEDSNKRLQQSDASEETKNNAIKFIKNVSDAYTYLTNLFASLYAQKIKDLNLERKQGIKYIRKVYQLTDILNKIED